MAIKMKILEQILLDFDQKNIDAELPEWLAQLQFENTEINFIDVLIECFRQKKLPERVKNKMHINLIVAITGDIFAGKIRPFDELGAAINLVSQDSLQKDYFYILSQLILNWQNNQTNDEVSKQIRFYLSKVIIDMNKI
jgi:hypothetical protein